MIKKIYKRLSIISVMVAILLLFNWISPVFASVSIQPESPREGGYTPVNTFNSVTLGTNDSSAELTAAAVTVGIVLLVIWLASVSTPPPSYTEYTFVTVPPGATVEVNGKVVGKTPCKFSLRNPVQAKIAVKKEGYRKIQATLTPSAPTKWQIVLK